MLDGGRVPEEVVKDADTTAEAVLHPPGTEEHRLHKGQSVTHCIKVN